MNKYVKIGLILLVVGALAAYLVYEFVINKSHPDYENLEPDYVVTAQQLYNDFANDRATAEQKYNGKMVQLSGVLDKIDQPDSLVIAVFVFNKGMFGEEGIRATMLPSHQQKLLQANSGTEITLKGFCTGYNDVDVILEKSSIIE
ncbi:MAG: OB-fold putative lipoprotein [Bacteroidales bacterium]|nr:OB-fold putative lipoprotein [Bacteroidales bacterium]MCF8344148.1 OB-fold putative lipoprotein [Bacteroidales bacterium]MCF8349985.1 OB-fold putative lipoprotein [Bacteroidales bacterium]MCF8376727.1 OB-fold putative lipoprotein [Bacteroidales bacterium]